MFQVSSARLGFVGFFLQREAVGLQSAAACTHVPEDERVWDKKNIYLLPVYILSLPDMCNGSANRHLKQFTLSHVKLFCSVASNN